MGRPRAIDHNTTGAQTARRLKRLKIKSPDTSEAIEIARGIKVVPKVKFRTEASKQRWIDKKREQLNITYE